MRIRFIILISILLLCVKRVFSFKGIQKLKKINGIQKVLKPSNQMSFHELRSRSRNAQNNNLNISVGDWSINITYKDPSNNPEKIKSLLIYSMTFPYTELDEFKEYLFE
ncbi:hypothetical protein YYC_01471 [Plasmodium yoelii 17X]|uniref:Fam-c protein n=3 Tax=Plasmodium yoelii TaxID=5861 RepID=A0A078KFH7_PLAYE|nr:conserved Plasmodium protein, unknown function [Plasmodium yoelii]ETB61615.1 hypothetical protein YYC_01471 [Plasmodium yoelii 17X]CDU20676.1 conserved Plasmodium protein, unknown function [Plasmodium yoelii]VTZ81639.1 conserved Plasmodium protein, unknown function [Plasmodium yoelii]|eukprot:XP_022812930.1 conserved Plasmodium protein, unknown function [Plasmodium yoelii]